MGRLHFPDVNERNHRDVVNAFEEVVSDAHSSTVRVLSDSRTVALGTVVSTSGHVLTKASELNGEIVCVTQDGRRRKASVLDAFGNTAILK